DDGVTALYQHLRDVLAAKGLPVDQGVLPQVDVRHSSTIRQVVPGDRVRYLSEITETIRSYHARTEELVEKARRVQRLELVRDDIVQGEVVTEPGPVAQGLEQALEKARKDLPVEIADQIEGWPAVVESYSGDEQVVRVRDKEIRTKLTKES